MKRLVAAIKKYRPIITLAALLALSVLMWVWFPLYVPYLRHHEYVSAFLIAFVAAIPIFLPTTPADIFAIHYATILNPFAVAIVTGLGSGLGEFMAFKAGQSGQDVMDKCPKWMQKIFKFQFDEVEKYGGVAIFVLAAIPNPFYDFLAVMLGVNGMSMKKFLAWTTLGRIVHYAILIYVSIWLIHGPLGLIFKL